MTSMDESALQDAIGKSGLPGVRYVLRSLGFSEARGFRDVATVWRSERSQREVVLPQSLEFADAIARIADIAVLLDSLELISISQFIDLVRSYSEDQINVGVTAPDISRNGDAALAEIAPMISEFQKVMVYGAWARLDKKRTYYGNRPKMVEHFEQSIRFGHTKKGSMVFTFSVPVPEINIGIDDAPFARIAFETCMALAGIVRTSLESPVSRIETFLTEGISSNYLAALSGLAGPSFNYDFSVSARFSPKIRRITGAPTSLAFSRSEAVIIREIAQEMEEVRVLDDVTIIGLVDQLRREPGETAGTIKIVGDVEGKSRHVTLTLPESKYNEAIHAHEHGLVVFARGVLLIHARSADLGPVREFRVMEDSLL